MANSYPIQFATQLRHHLRAFRKKRDLTQAQLGALIGVSQGRIAEIEANPGLVSFDQLMQLLSILDVNIVLSEMSAVTSSQNPTYASGVSNTAPQEVKELDSPNEALQKLNEPSINNVASKQMHDLGNVRKGSW
ncbi:helix-turn-helix domain-containing protein [Undibacterium pigrum]|uniref:Helix-turn-helix protein n=1 Tax=Undibacterium pigrum TaxID=401470 RepID=A0A318IP38_9BURK|nr:helix-turn-helix domain-containing protein [Undibacterium pigrum]PXX37826.1 helix-turn-helix protein [Undibacterium pigrum]